MRVALATVGTLGDVAPFALLARRLADRGHAVTAISWPVHRAALSAPGVRVEVAGPHADPARIASVAADAAGRGPFDQVAVLRDFHLADGEAHYRRLTTLLPGHDLVVLHGIHALAHAAVLDLGLRFATAVFDPVLLPTRQAPPPGMPPLGPLNRAAWWLLDRGLGRAGRPLTEVLARAGSHQRALPMFRARSDRLHLVGCSPALIEVHPDFPGGTRVTGAWLDRSAAPAIDAGLAKFLHAGAPPVVMTFGSTVGAPQAALSDAVDRVLGAGRRVVVQGDIGPGVSSPNLARVGPTDHRSLFARAAVVVHHGGAGTTHAACAAGAPSVIFPHVGDQRYWAERLGRLGVAPPAQAARRLDGAALAEAILATAADPLMHARADELAARMGQEDGLSASVGALEAAADRP